MMNDKKVNIAAQQTASINKDATTLGKLAHCITKISPEMIMCPSDDGYISFTDRYPKHKIDENTLIYEIVATPDNTPKITKILAKYDIPTETKANIVMHNGSRHYPAIKFTIILSPSQMHQNSHIGQILAHAESMSVKSKWTTNPNLRIYMINTLNAHKK